MSGLGEEPGAAASAWARKVAERVATTSSTADCQSDNEASRNCFILAINIASLPGLGWCRTSQESDASGYWELSGPLHTAPAPSCAIGHPKLACAPEPSSTRFKYVDYA